jgi:hypothetical protein
LREAKTDKERNRILTEGLEISQAEIKRLIEENDKMLTRIKELEEENKKLKEQNDNGLLELLFEANQEADKLGENIRRTQALIEIKKK